MHVAGGQGRHAPPPGTLALAAPRRAARGRVHDFLFLNLKLQGSQATDERLVDRLAQEATRLFFGTPGSVTAALRQAISQLNQELLSHGVQARLAAAALRNRNLYIAQCGSSQAILVRSATVSRIRAEDSTSRSLGSSLAPMIQFRHIELQSEDLLVLTASDGPLWSENSLVGLTGLDLTQALDRLVASSSQDLTGLLVRIPTLVSSPSVARTRLGGSITPELRPGLRVRARATQTRAEAARQTSPTKLRTPSSPDPATTQPVAPPALPAPARPSPRARVAQAQVSKAEGPVRLDRLRPELRPRGARRGLSEVEGPVRWRALIRRFRHTIGAGWQALIEGIGRMAPGLNVPGMFSPNLLAFTAAAVPILVVGVSSVVYFKRGRVEQFESYLAQAQAAAVAAQVQGDPQAARPEWVMASQWLDLAESYRQTDDSIALRQQVEGSLDSIDLIYRLDFAPAVSGGFGSTAEINQLAASATDLYAFDRGTHTIWHAWSTGRGYEIDSQFECLAGAESIPGFDDPISLVIQPEPGALGAEGVVAIDPDGTLLYCAPGAQPLTGQLATPDVGWGRLQAIEVSGNGLYVLDPEKNSVWIYDASGGLFSGTPALYFAEAVPQLGTAIDLALALDELIILYADGGIDRCRRNVENSPEGNLRIRIECEQEPRFQDQRPEQPPRASIPGAVPASIEYSPPPEPSLFFLDLSQGTVFHYSMRLVYQGQYPTPFGSEATAITSGPPNDLFVAVGDQVYYALLGR